MTPTHSTKKALLALTVVAVIIGFIGKTDAGVAGQSEGYRIAQALEQMARSADQMARNSDRLVRAVEGVRQEMQELRRSCKH